MSEIDETLQLFGFLTLDEVTPDALKRAFKVNILRAHPDKGGSPELFDKMLASYVFLTETVQRLMGGRATLQNIVSPEELKGMRPDEIVNRFFEEFDNDIFNARFEEEKHSGANRGYGDWLKNTADEGNLVRGTYGDATQKPPSISEGELNAEFERKAREGKAEPQAIILHPEAMAYISGQCIGTEIIESAEGDFTSAPFLTPEYTDVYSAFTSANTICDKVPSTLATKTLEELVAEREVAVTPLNDTERKAIQEYEQKQLETNINNLSKVKEHFMHEGNSAAASLANWPETIYPPAAYKGFVLNF
jgi:hypothetical protein